MCLYTLHKDPLIAEKDIECYKIMRIEKRCFGILNVLSSPFVQNTYYALFNHKNITAKDSRKPVESFKCSNNYKLENYEAFKIDVQGVHCYQTAEDANNALKHSILHIHVPGLPPAVIVKCIIPKGTRYWTNKEYLERCERTNYMYAELASEKLKVCITDVLHLQ